MRIDHGAPSPLIDLNAELESEEPEEEKLEQIHIDDEGIIKTADQIDAMKQKVVEPLPDVSATEDRDQSRLITQPPTLGGTLTANSTPEGLDPSTDPLGLSAKPSPLLSHETSSAADNPLNKPLDDMPAPTAQDIIGASPFKPQLTDPEPSIFPTPSPNTLSDLEKVVDSPHVKQVEEPPVPLVADPTDGDVNAARDAVMQAVSSSKPQVLEPVQSLNAQPMDLNLGDMPAVATSPASAFAGDSAMVNPSLATSLVVPDASLAANPVLSTPGLRPPAPGLPSDNTAAQITDPTAPPPVPPPLIPPVMPPPEDKTLGTTAP